MPKYLINLNLPSRFSIWNTEEYILQKDINDESTDEQIWQYALQNNLTIITKDSDFATKIILKNPPPRVIHIRIGNMKMNEFHQYITSIWADVLLQSANYKLIRVFRNRLEVIA